MRFVGWSLGLGSLLVLFGSPPAAAQSQPAMRWMPAHSSNYSVRSSRVIDRIVIHTVEGSEAGCISWFKNSRSNVSAHFVVAHSGRITRMVQDKNVAWHVRNYNSRSIGIENEGYAQRNTWTNAQYDALARLVAWLCTKYRIPVSRTGIKSHAELDPRRRSDPGPYFNWTRFLNLVRAKQSGGSTPTPPTRPAPKPPAPTPTGSARSVETTASTLNVRTSVWGRILGSVPRGAKFVLTGATSGSWRQIYYAGKRAWVHGSYLRGYGGSGQEVTASWLNVRTGGSTRYGRIGAVARGQRYVQLGSSGSWRRIQFDRRGGWAHGSYLVPVRLSR